MSCDGCGPNKNIIPVYEPPGGGTGDGGKKVELIPSDNIGINDLSDADTYRFQPYYVAGTPLTVELTLVAKAGGVVKTSPILKGTTIDTLELDWVYNKTISSQSLSNTGGLVPPTLAASVRSYDYTGQTITANMSVTIQGNDGSGPKSDSKSIAFGNYIYTGHGLSKLGSAASTLQAFITAMTATVKTSRAHTYFATGGENEKHFVAIPKVFGLATFTKAPFVGGYVRLKNVGGTLLADAGEDPETDILLTNSLGFEEAYYVYESLIDNQADAVTPFVIS
jgi:hypothetical protein